MRVLAGVVPGTVMEFFARKAAWMGVGGQRCMSSSAPTPVQPVSWWVCEQHRETVPMLCRNRSALSQRAPDTSSGTECVPTLSRVTHASRRLGAHLGDSHCEELLFGSPGHWILPVGTSAICLISPLPTHISITFAITRNYDYLLFQSHPRCHFKLMDARQNIFCDPPTLPHLTSEYSYLQAPISEGFKRFVNIQKALWHSLRQYSMPLEGSIILIQSQDMHFSFLPSLFIKGYADVDLTSKKKKSLWWNQDK